MTEPAGWVKISTYSLKYAADRKTVYKWVEAGLIRSFRAGRTVRVLDTPPAATPELALERVATTDLRSFRDTEPDPLPKRPYFKPRDGAFHVNGTSVPDAPGVYVVRSGNAAKIGCSANLRRRLYTLQSVSFETLPVLGYLETSTMDGAYRLEHALHEQFREARLRGEWFALTQDVVTDLLKHHGVWDRRMLLSAITRTD